MGFGFLKARRARGQSDPFAEALRDYGLELCAVSGGRLDLGLGPDGGALMPVTEMPDGLTQVRFLRAPDQADLIAAFLRSPLSQHVTRLVLGTTQDYTDPRGLEIDMSAALRVLAGGSLPALTSLAVGDMEQRFGGRRDLGYIGDVARVLAACPRLVELELFGTFDLSAPLFHAELAALSVEAKDAELTAGRLSQATLDTLLLSELPQLAFLRLALDAPDTEAAYDLPSDFPADHAMPNLLAVEIEGFTPEATERVQAWRDRDETA
ncbi:hypothetical protein E0K89_001275 [Aquicoccus sp. SCR17]|nr:hypothetical protein [Carideicomes alvinocaridis]